MDRQEIRTSGPLRVIPVSIRTDRLTYHASASGRPQPTAGGEAQEEKKPIRCGQAAPQGWAWRNGACPC